MRSTCRLGPARTVLLALTAFAAGPVADPAWANEAKLLKGEQIRQIVGANRIYLATPLGGEMPLNYRPGGRVDGTGEAIGLGRFFRPNDSGRWWITGDLLCQQWQTWYNGERLCFTLEQVGANRLIWRRDNGESGRARFVPNARAD